MIICKSIQSGKVVLLRSLRGLALRNLPARRLRTALTGIAIMLGVAAVFATSLIARAAQARTAELARLGSQASLHITPRQDEAFDARVLGLVRAHPAVALASPELQFRATANGAPLIVLGVEPEAYRQMEQPHMAQGRYLPSATVQWAVVPERWAEQNGVRVGDRLSIPLQQGRVQVRVAGLRRHEDDAGAVVSDRTALMPLNTLQALTGQRRRLGAIQIALRDGVDPRRAEAELSAVLAASPLGRQVVVSPTGDGGSSNRLYAMMQGGLLLSGAAILLAAAFLIFNTFAMSVAERTREIGILRALGMERGGVWRGVLTEAGILGLAGALAGLPLGWGLAQGIIRLLSAWQGFEIEGLVLSVGGLLAAPLVGLGVALAAAWLPARDAAAISPLAAILNSPRAAEARRGPVPAPASYPIRGTSPRGPGRSWLAGVLLLSGSLGVVVWMILVRSHTLEFTQLSLLCTGVAVLALAGGLLLLPALATGLIAALRAGLLERLGTVGRLSGDQLARHRQRSMLTAGTLAVGLAMVITLSGVLGTLIKSAEDLVFGLMRDDFVVFYMPPDQTLEAADPRSLLRQQEWPRPVVEAIQAVRDRAYVYSLHVTGPVEGLEATPGTGLYALDDLETFLRVGSYRFEEGNFDTALRIVRQGRALLIPPATARRFGVGVGDRMWVNTRRGRLAFLVAGVGASPWFGSLVSYADAERYFGVLPAYGYMITARRDVSAAAVRLELERGLARHPDYALYSLGRESDAIQDVIGKPMRALGTLLNGITLLAVVIASLGQINTTTMSILERVRELGVLRAAGMTRGQVQRLVLLEAASVGLVGSLIGAAVGLGAALLYTLTWSTVGLEAMGFGAPTPGTVWEGIGSTMRHSLPGAGLALIVAPLLTALAAWGPSRRAAGLPIVEAIRHEAAALGRKGKRA
jgi:putative ABC transport system permease protein